jgi:UDP-N-acetylmuramoyl-tripeptide--D-alanyl-D-alanine ligase
MSPALGHQAVNASAAAAAAWGMGIAPEQICAALPLTVLPGMRSKITRLEDVTYINDAYNANPARMAAALDYLEESAGKSPLVLLLGAMLELGEKTSSAHEELLQTTCERFPQAQIFTFGKPFEDAAKKYCVRFFEHPADAAEEVASTVRAGTIVFAKGSRGIGVENALPPEAR